jgi:hypothetical protein
MSRIAARLIAAIVLTLIVTGGECAAFCSAKACQTTLPPCHRHKNAPAGQAQACTLETAAVQPAATSVDLACCAVAIEAPRVDLTVGEVTPAAVPSPPHPDLLLSTVLRI